MALKVAILESGLTQRVTARRARIDETRLSRIISQQESPSDTEMRRLARVLKSQVENLFPAQEAVAS